MRATSQTKTIKDIVSDVNNELEVIYQKGPFKMKKKDFRLKKIRKLHDDWKNISKNEAKISILKKEYYTNSLYVSTCSILQTVGLPHLYFADEDKLSMQIII